jgi:hypothetical protein
MTAAVLPNSPAEKRRPPLRRPVGLVRHDAPAGAPVDQRRGLHCGTVRSVVPSVTVSGAPADKGGLHCGRPVCPPSSFSIAGTPADKRWAPLRHDARVHDPGGQQDAPADRGGLHCGTIFTATSCPANWLLPPVKSGLHVASAEAVTVKPGSARTQASRRTPNLDKSIKQTKHGAFTDHSHDGLSTQVREPKSSEPCSRR